MKIFKNLIQYVRTYLLCTSVATLIIIVYGETALTYAISVGSDALFCAYGYHKTQQKKFVATCGFLYFFVAIPAYVAREKIIFLAVTLVCIVLMFLKLWYKHNGANRNQDTITAILHK